MPENIAAKLDVDFDGARIKIEVTPVSRGCVFDPVTMSVSEKVEAAFGFAETKWCRSPIFTGGRSSPRLIGSIRAICSMSAISWRQKA